MANGKTGDHPYTDIVAYGVDVYSPKIAGLVREIANLADDNTSRELADTLLSEYNDTFNADVDKLERILIDMRDRLLRDAKERSFEV